MNVRCVLCGQGYELRAGSTVDVRCPDCEGELVPARRGQSAREMMLSILLMELQLRYVSRG